MVSEMESGNVNSGEDVRSLNTGTLPIGNSNNCSSARQSPKITTPSPSALLLQRNTASPSLPKKIMSKNHNNTGNFSYFYFLFFFIYSFFLLTLRYNYMA